MIFRMPCKEQLEAEEFVRHPLDVVHPVHPEDNLSAFEGFHEFSHPLHDPAPFTDHLYVVWIDPDREHSDRAVVILVVHSLRARLHFLLIQDPRTRLQEMARVVVGVETYEICLQQPLQELSPDGEDPIDLTGREGRVQKPRHPNIRHPVPEIRGQAHEMVVMDPDQVRGLANRHHGLAEFTVRILVRLPQLHVELPFAVGLVHG
mmetsp:Transcript_63584/g.87395  ORF Transcript_63584/g.87395 Transcript_63584/m.87395 type:complete len:205 (-) Transcript_63584:407-1021(-)